MKSIRKNHLLVLMLTALLFVSFLSTIPKAFGTNTCGATCSVSVTPSSGNHGTQFNITTTITVPAGKDASLDFIGVVTPNGEVFTCGPVSALCSLGSVELDNFGGGSPATGTCTVPFGASASLSKTGAVFGCTGSNSAAWVQQTIRNTLALLEDSCSRIAGDWNPSPGTAGSTSEAGTYTVIACWTNPSVFGGLFAETSFTVNATLNDILHAISTLSNAFGTAVTNIENHIDGTIATAVTNLESFIASINATLSSQLTSIQSLIASVNATLSSQLTSIQNALAKLSHTPQETTAASETTFTPSSTTTTILTLPSNKIGQVTVSIGTSGVTSGENVYVRYYTDPSHPSVFIQKTLAHSSDNLGISDTASAWKVVILVTYPSSSTNSVTVNWSISALTPPA